MGRLVDWARLRFPEFDYLELSALLKGYAQPRRMISYLCQTGQIVRIRKGVYILGKNHPRYSPPSQYRLANILYGPSYLSLQTALAYYGLIPEAVHEVTSMNAKRHKRFTTPLGVYSYHYLAPNIYSVGIEFVPVDQGGPFLIATPVKALLDLIWLHRRGIEAGGVQTFLEQDMRVDMEDPRIGPSLEYNRVVKLYGFAPAIAEDIIAVLSRSI